MRRTPAPTVPGEITGRARVGRRTEDLVSRLRAGDIAVIDQVDLDRAAAARLAQRRPAAVVNGSPTVSGRFPAFGASVLIEAGIPLLDEVGSDLLTRIVDGDTLRIDGVRILAGEKEIARGRRQDEAGIAETLEHARAGLARQVGAFSDAAAEYVAQEQDLLIDRIGVPAPPIDLADRDVLIVTGGVQVSQQLRELRPFINDRRPAIVALPESLVVLAATRGAPTPDLLVGDPLQLPDDALRQTPRVLVPGTASPEAVVAAERLGVVLIPFPGAVGAEDAALLLADAAGARNIVVTGPGLSLPEFLDRGRTGMAGSLLTRVVAGGRLVPADRAVDLHRREVPGWAVVLLVVAGLLAVAAALAVTPVGQDWIEQLGGLP